jgi:hypothetical protein
MAGEYELRLYGPTGSLQTIITDSFELDYTLVVNGVGVLVVTLPTTYDSLLFASGDVILDNRLEVWRKVAGGSPYLEGLAQWLVQKGDWIEGDTPLTRITALHANCLLDRRIVAYNSGSSQADKSAAAADNRMKDVVDENLLAAAVDTDRSIATYLQLQSDAGAGASISKAFSRRNVLAVLQEYAQSSTLAGTYLAFDIVSLTSALLEFRTYAGQRGVDRRWPNGVDPVLIGPEYGNIAEARLTFDHTVEKTVVYAGGQGEGAARTVAESEDASRTAASVLGRREMFIDSRMTNDATQLADEADASLRSQRPKQSFSALLVETDGSVYGLHYGYGDFLTVQLRGQSIECRLDTVHVRLAERRENIEMLLRAEL